MEFYDVEGNELPTSAGDPTLPNTYPIPPGFFQRIRAHVSCPPGAEKYIIENIDIVGISGGFPRDRHAVSTRSTVAWLGNSISDNDNRGPNKYYQSFAGHNVNPGMMTSYVLDVFGTPSASGNVLVTRGSVPPGWSAVLRHGTSSGASVTVPAGDMTLGSNRSVVLEVVAPTNALVGAMVDVTVTFSRTGASDSVEISTRVVEERKTVIIAYSGVQGDSLWLDRYPYKEQNTDGPLWNNVHDMLVSSGAVYENAIANHIVSADCVYVSMVASAYAEQTGIMHAGTGYLGWDHTTNLPLYGIFNNTYLGGSVETLFNAVKRTDPELRTAIVNAKFYIGDTMADEDVDIVISPQQYPFYVESPRGYLLGEPGEGVRPPIHMPDNWAQVWPSDEWVFNAAMAAVEYEDPDVILIMNAGPDAGGHLYGGEVDGPQEYQTQEYNEKVDIGQQLAVVNNTDRQTGRFLSLLQSRTGLDGRNGLKEAIVAVIDLYQEAVLEFSVAGTPGNTVLLEVLEDGIVVTEQTQARETGRPLVDSLVFPVRPNREYTLRLSHTGEGANPVSLVLMGEDTQDGDWNTLEYEVVLNHQQHLTATLDIGEDLADVFRDNKRVWFDGSQSYDVDGEITQYTWYIEEDELDGILVDYVYSETGDYTVWLSVMDDEEAYGLANTTFHLSSMIILPPYYPPYYPPYPQPIRRPITFTVPADRLYIEYRWQTEDVWQEWTEEHSYTHGFNPGGIEHTWTVPGEATGFQARFRLRASSYFFDPGPAGSIHLDNILLTAQPQ